MTAAFALVAALLASSEAILMMSRNTEGDLAALFPLVLSLVILNVIRNALKHNKPRH